MSLTLNQLIGDQFAVGASWRVTRSELETAHPELRSLLPDLTDTATLQEISLFADWNSPNGWFAHIEANGYHQDLNRQDTYERLRTIANTNANPADDLSARSGDSFIQLNAWAGYRFNDNLCEVALGVLNIGGTDYQLSPLNPRAEIARDRTFFATCRLSF